MAHTLADAIAALDGYIATLEAVTDPTPAQAAELTRYRARRSEYQARQAASLTALVPLCPPAVDPATLGPFGQVPAGVALADWLAAPASDTCGLLRQYVYVWLHPGCEPDPSTWPVSDTVPAFEPLGIAQLILEALGWGGVNPDGSAAPYVTQLACGAEASAYLQPIARRLMYAAELEVTPDHYIWPAAAWALVGGRTLAIAENDPAVLPPDDPRPRWSGDDLFARLVSATGQPAA